jgi:hypothetical protein
MLLNDIGKSPNTTLRKINQHLEANYGFKISENASDKDLVSIMEKVQEEIIDLKLKGDDAKVSPEISKRLLVLEGMRNLREFAMMQFQSPDLDRVIDGMTTLVVEHFRLAGCEQSDFEYAVQRAMDEYRSSEYRFPDDLVEQRIRQGAMAQIQSMSSPEADAADMGLGEGRAAMDRAAEADWMSSLGPETEPPARLGRASPPSDPEQNVPMIRDKRTGRMVPDPFELQKIKRKQGIVMQEKMNLVKNLRKLLETEVSQAEVMMAAKKFAEELQEMIEKIGRLQNEDLPPVTDQMRETYGTDSASAFQTAIYGAFQGVMDSLYTAKAQVDDAVTNMATTGQVSAQIDMDKDIETDMGMDDMDAGMDADLDNIEGELAADDEFGGADEEDPLGRPMKTESVELRRRITEMKKLVEKARKLRVERV